MLLIRTQLLQSPTFSVIIDEELSAQILGFDPKHHSRPDSDHVYRALGGAFADGKLFEGHLVVVLDAAGLGTVGYGEIVNDVSNSFEVCDLRLGELRAN